MIRPPPPGDEDARLKALRRYAMRDRSPDPVLDQITAMIAELFDVPYVLVSLVDEGCQWFKSHHGIDVEETSREISFCAHALHGEGTFEVPDARKDERFFDNPLVTDFPFIRYYLGALLTSPEGLKIGTLCIIDTRLRQFTEQQHQHLTLLAGVVMQRLELHRLYRQERAVTDSGLGLWELDVSSGATWWNDAVYDLYRVDKGYGHDRELGISGYHAEDQITLRACLDGSVKNQEPFDIDLRLKSDCETETTWVRVTGSPVAKDKSITHLAGTIQDITALKNNEINIRKNQRIERLVNRLQSYFIAKDDLSQAFSEALEELLFLTGSESGFIGEVLHRDDGTPFIKMHAITDISSDRAAFERFKATGPVGMEFTRLDSLFGRVLQSGEMLISNAPSRDPRRGGLPEGHPPLCAFIGIPVKVHGTMVAMLGLANRPNGYHAALAKELSPFIRSLGQLIDSLRLRVQHEEARRRLELSARIFADSQDAIMITDKDNRIVDVNGTFERITGYSRDEALNQNPKFISSGCHEADFYRSMWDELYANGMWRGELVNRRKDGELLPELLSLSLIRNQEGQVTHHVGVYTDLTTIKNHKKELYLASHFDELTLLPNRHEIVDTMRESLVRIRENSVSAIVVIDLDKFHEINVRLGRDSADQVLVSVSERLQDYVGSQGVVARLGGDEFALVVHEFDGSPALFAGIDAALVLSDTVGFPLVVTASVGVTLFPIDDSDPDTLLRHADQAMYHAKIQGGNTHVFFDPDQERDLKERKSVHKELAHGLRAGQFELYFQPQIDTQSRRLLGVEALTRWHHPERGLVMPDQFLSLIAGSEVELEFDAWVLQSSLVHLSTWYAMGLRIGVSINLTPQSLVRESFVHTLSQALASYPDIPHNLLCIEVLESAALEDLTAATRILDHCRELGVRVALDDFGTGYSSLSYLRDLPIGIVKIDKRFVMGMLERKEDFAIVESVTYLAKRFGKRVVAEGVESQAHIDRLQLIGCDVVQGYGIAKPMPASGLLSWIKARPLKVT